VEVVEATHGFTRLRVGSLNEVAAIMAAARDGTEIVSFAYHPPTLSELFRQAVAA
jgi:ABC-2 type transport system ATP-binding protein